MKLYGIWVKEPGNYDCWISPGSKQSPHEIFHTPYLSVANAQALTYGEMLEKANNMLREAKKPTIEMEIEVREIGEDGRPV